MITKTTIYRVALGALLLATSSAHAAVATLDNINSSDGGATLFDPGTTSIAATGDPLVNMVTIGLMDFEASTDDVASPSTALDTIFMTVNAPDGYLITGINYFESGSYTVTGGVVGADGSIVVGGVSTDLGSPTVVADAVGTAMGTFMYPVSVDIDPTDSVDISATNSLFAVVFGSPGASASIVKDVAYFEVELTAIPLPPAVWMLGSALVGLVAVRRKAS
ncbi:MAG: VPLPA-CTERM sorting domain-containing protein [Pseudomonadota bacterium]